MPPRKTAKVPENLLIVVHYTGPNGTLTEEEKKRFIKNLKKNTTTTSIFPVSSDLPLRIAATVAQRDGLPGARDGTPVRPMSG
uniref:Uncharacterized protein n=1 Tax=viral metagenome TaxID=1070528 RepID=A0A6C0DRM0_9ZZZZ